MGDPMVQAVSGSGYVPPGNPISSASCPALDPNSSLVQAIDQQRLVPVLRDKQGRMTLGATEFFGAFFDYCPKGSCASVGSWPTAFALPAWHIPTTAIRQLHSAC